MSKAPEGFYVYQHACPGSDRPFYVGKGKDYRAWSRQNRNTWWRRVVSKHCDAFPIVTVLRCGLTEEEAIDIERFWIALYGRINVHPAGVLVNLTDGGEGVSGLRWTDAARQRMSQERSGKNSPMYGKKRSEETRRKISESWRFRAPVSEVTRKRQSEARRGRKHTPEARSRIACAKRSYWASAEERDKRSLRSGAVAVLLEAPDGTRHLMQNRRAFAHTHSLQVGCLIGLAKGTRKTHKGWRLVLE